MLIYSCKKLGTDFVGAKSFGDIIEYPETRQIHRTTKWKKGTIILGELTTGRKGLVTYEFNISEDLLAEAKYAEIHVDKLFFNGRREKAIGKVRIGNSELFFIQDLSTGKPYQHLLGGFWAKRTWQKPDQPKMIFHPEKSCIQIPFELLSKEIRCAIEVSEIQQIIIRSIELKIFS